MSITRTEIIQELKKNKGKDKDKKKEAIVSLLQTKKIDKKKIWMDGRYAEVNEIEMILSDLESYKEYNDIA